MSEYEPVKLEDPIEVDCECGHHQVIDPDALTAFVKKRRFTCFDCGRKRLPMSLLRAMTWNAAGDVVGICDKCDGKYEDGR